MAIAFNAGSVANSGTWLTSASSWNTSHTTSGSNILLLAGVMTYNASLRTVSSIVFNTSESLSLVDSITANLESQYQDCELWSLHGAGAATANVSVTLSGTSSYAMSVHASYTGVPGSSYDATAKTQQTGSATTASPANNVNVVASDCWLMGISYHRGLSTTAGSGTTRRAYSSYGHAIGDSGGTVGTGNQTLNWTANTNVTWPGLISASYSASAGGGGTNPKGVFGLSLDGPLRRVVYP